MRREISNFNLICNHVSNDVTSDDFSGKKSWFLLLLIVRFFKNSIQVVHIQTHANIIEEDLLPTFGSCVMLKKKKKKKERIQWHPQL